MQVEGQEQIVFGSEVRPFPWRGGCAFMGRGGQSQLPANSFCSRRTAFICVVQAITKTLAFQCFSTPDFHDRLFNRLCDSFRMVTLNLGGASHPNFQVRIPNALSRNRRRSSVL